MNRRPGTTQTASCCDLARASLRALLVLALVLQALAAGHAWQPQSVAAVEAAALGDLCVPGGDAPRRDDARCDHCTLCASPLHPAVAVAAAQPQHSGTAAGMAPAGRLLGPASSGPPLPARGPPARS